MTPTNGYTIEPGADLRGAELRYADLRSADLRGANLRGAELRYARYSISAIMTANWGDCPPDVTAQLQRLVAEAMPHGHRLMDQWAASDDGPCPLQRTTYDRVALFAERRECWPPRGLPWTLWQIWQRLAQAMGVKISMPWSDQ